MSVETIYRCDRCKRSFDTYKSNLYKCVVTAISEVNNHAHRVAEFTVGKDVCWECLEKLGIKLGSMYTNADEPRIVNEQQDPLAIETLVREIARDKELALTSNQPTTIVEYYVVWTCAGGKAGREYFDYPSSSSCMTRKKYLRDTGCAYVVEKITTIIELIEDSNA